MNEYIRQASNDKTPEKKEVEDYRRKLKDKMDEVLDKDQNATYQV